ncbi:MAG: methyltransferase domain-containing protein, partial [Anaerolineales bacterium]|nr:methyltransferase domain-containing protein [Anaerolineales bacterium]
EIGCGTGELTVMMAERGADVSAIDASSAMLSEAQKRVANKGLEGILTLRTMDATLIGERFPPAAFDLIVSTLVFSELSPDQQNYVLEACATLLAPGGILLIADEVIPQRSLARIAFYLVRWPVALLTWLLTRATTNALRDFDSSLARVGFKAVVSASYLMGSLVLYEISLSGESSQISELPPTAIGQLRHRVSLRNSLIDLWTLFFRILPPYPKIRPGLYAVGQPDEDSPVLVTGNFDLTVRRLVRAIDCRVDAWLLVADSRGINVWCAAGGGYFSAEKVISAVKSSRLADVVHHQTLILPQLCANGVDGGLIQGETGWSVLWGPVTAEDIPQYLTSNREKSDDMRWVRFPLKDRLEMVTVTLGFYALLILLPVLIFWRESFWQVAVSLLGLSYVYAVIHPWLPGRDGLQKSIPLALIALAGLFAYTIIWDPLPSLQFFNWTIGLIGLSVFTGAELQGMSPLMRGEQANWGWEVLIGAVLLLAYWLIPLVLGWR